MGGGVTLKGVNRKDSLMDRVSNVLYEKFWISKGEKWDRKLKVRLRLLHSVSDQELTQMVRQYRKEQIQLVFFFCIILCVGIIATVTWMFFPGKSIKIERADYGEGQRTEIIYPKHQDPIEFTVGEQEYTKQELEKAFSEGFQWIRENMLLENVSAAEIHSNLNFPLEVPGGIKVEWISENPDVISEDGTVHNDNWSAEQKELVTVTVLLMYREEMRWQELHLMVKAPVLSATDKLKRRIRIEIENIEKKTRNNKIFWLPAVIEGIELKKTQSTRQIGGGFFLIFVIFFLLFYRKHNSLQEQIEQRKEEIQEDYPLIVNKLVLYLSAGVNIKTAFEKISVEYQEDKKEGRIAFRFAYQELYVMMNQLKAGMSETKAYEDYGRRIGENTYLKFMTLIIQNLQKGNAGLLKALSEEEEQAFAKRIDRAKRQGEEAGTKLLFPMLVLLVVVMAITILPAVFQFRNY